MLVFIMISLFHVQPLSENNQHILSSFYGPHNTKGCSSTNLDNLKLLEEHNKFTISHSVHYENKTEEHSNPTFLLFKKTTLISKGLDETTQRLQRLTFSDASGLYELDVSSTVGGGDHGLNSSTDKGRRVFNETFDDEWSEFNETFEEKAREDGYQITKPEQNPYSVLLISKGAGEGDGLCTGSLLTDEWVLTAAHCVTLKNDELVDRIEIYAGVNSLQDVQNKTLPMTAQLQKSTEFYPHPGYRSGGEKHDVAVVKALGRFNITNTVKTIKLTTEPWTTVGYRTCKITGFGKVNYKKSSTDDYKRKTHTLSVKKPCKCNFRLKQMYGMNYPTKSYICAKPMKDYGICSGDSGGGLVCDGKIHATAMMIVKMHDTKDCEVDILSKVACASDRGLTVFLGTCPYLRWINSRVKVLQEDQISPKCVEINGQSRVTQASLLCVTVAVALRLLLGFSS